eukprot:Nitzschia sp. Nitz4//scaffold67_size101165//79895//80785//NITZ4_004539-RA/size101165-processed-gene-0.48-mRNA-1//1//CDS//3329556504//9387//frame0
MPQPAFRLGNLYVPLPLSNKNVNGASATTESSTSKPPLRTDRSPEELRQLCMEVGIIQRNVLGSALVELGHTKVLCQVSITPCHPDALPDDGVLHCSVRFAPHVGLDASLQRAQAVSPLDSSAALVSAGKLNSEASTREKSLGSQLHSALISVVPTRRFPKCAIGVQLIILQDDGSVLSTCITAATMALVDARVELLDMVTSCTVAICVPDGPEDDPAGMDEDTQAIFLADPTELEQIGSSAILCLAMTPNQKEVTLWRQSGKLDIAQTNQAIELCRRGCRTMHKLMREAWLSNVQ